MLAQIVAVVFFSICQRGMAADIEVIIDRRVAKKGPMRCELVKKERERIGGWICGPLAFWWLPVVFAFIGMISGRLVF